MGLPLPDSNTLPFTPTLLQKFREAVALRDGGTQDPYGHDFVTRASTLYHLAEPEERLQMLNELGKVIVADLNAFKNDLFRDMRTRFLRMENWLELFNGFSRDISRQRQYYAVESFRYDTLSKAFLTNAEELTTLITIGKVPAHNVESVRNVAHDFLQNGIETQKKARNAYGIPDAPSNRQIPVHAICGGN